MRGSLYVLALTLFGLLSHAQDTIFDAVIAADGTGDYETINLALSRVRTKASGRYLFLIKSGVYSEKVNVAKDNLSLIGDPNGEVIIQWDDYSGDPEAHSTSTSYTVQIDADGFYAENITFKNTAGKVGQAVAVSSLGSQVIFKNCKFYGFQDTYYARKGMAYHLNSYVEGGTDFIFGDATTVFQDSEIVCVQGGQYITAPADSKLITQVNGSNFYHGLLFKNCHIKAGTGVGTEAYYLGRPWQPNSSSVYIDCIYDNHIKAAGWSTWDGTNHLSSVFAEYQNKDANGNLVNVSQRVSWSKQLTQSEVTNYYNDNYFLNGWNPTSITSDLGAPQNLTPSSAAIHSVTLTWSAVNSASGYAVFRNDQFIGASLNESFTDDSATEGDSFKVVALGTHAQLGVFSDAVIGHPLLAVSGISLSSVGNKSEIQIGHTLQLEASVTPESADDLSVTWSSTNPSIATVSITGLVSGISEGQVTISAEANDGSGVVGTMIVNVIVILDSETFTESWKVFPNPVSGKIQFEVDFIPESVKILTVDGREVKSKRMTQGDDLSIDTDGLAMGSYLLKVIGSSESRMTHFVLK